MVRTVGPEESNFGTMVTCVSRSTAHPGTNEHGLVLVGDQRRLGLTPSVHLNLQNSKAGWTRFSPQEEQAGEETKVRPEKRNPRWRLSDDNI